MWYSPKAAAIWKHPTGVGKTHPPLSRCKAGRKHPHGRGEDTPKSVSKRYLMETPPRAWGRRGSSLEPAVRVRNTPTGVGKTQSMADTDGLSEKHPHGRGEDDGEWRMTRLREETPPRAWGRRGSSRCLSLRHRNTPTGVGKTQAKPLLCQFSKKHPHGRGEDSVGNWPLTLATETPPRAWGRRLRWKLRRINERNTPTGVGKTRSRAALSRWSWKHPHGRGEDGWFHPGT